ncbi:MAG TPA: type II secretion system secretin GspD [Stellaceae bacterium]|nr:type II secretion system secretin GspD [Stellaceae bacterium]
MIQRWRWWFVLGSMVMLAACDMLSAAPRPASPPTVGPGGPMALAPGRAVANVPFSRQPGNPTPQIVVHGIQRPGPVTAGPPANPDGDIQLNFAGADIRDVINSILGETLKLNYVIDPDVTGPVTFNVSRPVSRAELLPTLEAVLNSRGATMVKVNGIIRVMLRAKAGKAGTGAPLAGDGGPQPLGERTEVFPMRYVAPSEMQKVLQKVLPAGQVIIADDKQHLLTVQGSATELSLAAQTIRIFDIDQLSGTSMALVPLHNAKPASIADELRNIFSASTNDATNNAIRFMAIDRLNAVMVVTRSGYYLDQARSWIARLDHATDLNQRRVYVYNLQYAKASDVGQKLEDLLSNLHVHFKRPGPPPSSEGVGAAPGPNGDKGAATAKPDSPKPPPRPDQSAEDDSGKTDGQHPGVRIEADEAHNALLISATGRDYQLIRQVLEGIDVPPLQVLIEVTIAEVVLNDQLNYGVEYFINSGKTNTLLTTGSTPFGITPSVPGFALSWVAGNFNPRAILNLLSGVTQTRVISTPRLLVLSNETARLQVGDVVPIITQSASSTVTSNPLIVNSVTYKETGVVLDVTPRVNAGGYVTLDVSQSVSDVLNTTTSQIDSPTFRQRRLTSTISVKSGETILLGGLIQQEDNRSNSGIPVLHDIPWIGPLFGTHNNNTQRTELIMLLTPHVIANSQQSRDLTRSIESEFSDVLDRSTLAGARSTSR